MKSNARNLLNKHHLKYSKQREILIDFLYELDRPITIEECYDMLRSKGANMNLSTVYRIVDTFSQHGFLEKVYNSITNTTMIQIIKHHHHHYLICVSCHKMIPIDFCPIKEALQYIEKDHHFKVTAHQLEISGYCQECQIKADR